MRLIILIAFLYIYLNIVNSVAEHTTHNKYGDYGTLEVIDYLKLNEIKYLRLAS